MPRRLTQSFGGMRAAVLHALDHNRTVLIETLTRLGLQVSPFDPEGKSTASDLLGQADLVFFDSDLAEAPCLPCSGEVAPMPLVVVIGLETPSRLQRAFELGPSAVLHKPLRSSGIYSALFFAINVHRRRAEMAERLKALEARHGARRFVHKAVLQLMDLHGINDEQAYRLLRKESMRQRVTIEELSMRLLSTGAEREQTAQKA